MGAECRRHCPSAYFTSGTDIDLVNNLLGVASVSAGLPDFQAMLWERSTAWIVRSGKGEGSGNRNLVRTEGNGAWKDTKGKLIPLPVVAFIKHFLKP